MLSEKFILNLCPTGMVPRSDKVPHVPIRPKEIAQDVRRCYELGVSMIHLHARNSDESPSWDAKIYSELIHEVRDISPELIIVVSTSGRDWSELEKRTSGLTIDDVKPDMASLTLGSMNFPNQASVNSPEMIQNLISTMNSRGIKPELEVFNTGMANYANYLIQKEILKPPYYYNLIFGSLGSASLNARNIAAMLDTLPQNATWAMGGVGRYQLPANTMALALGGHVRIGLEDNPYFDWSNKSHASNPQLVERVIRLAKELGREPASPTEARIMLGLC